MSYPGSVTVSCLRETRGSGWSLVALTVFKTVRDLTSSGWVGSIPMHSRHRARSRRRGTKPSFILHSCMLQSIKRTLIALAAVLIVGPAAAGAQRPDSTRITTAPPPGPDSLVPPITPRRAMFYSFLLPGYSQSRLGRHKAAAAFMFVEAMSLAMIRESAADVHEARRAVDDTIVVSYVDRSGNPLSTPTTVLPRFSSKEIATRKAHVEDWLAVLVANHLFAGADAFVAAHLWDVPAHVSFRLLPGTGTASLSASMRW